MSSGPVLVIRGGTVVDASGWRRADVVVASGQVVAVDEAVEPEAGWEVLEADGCWVAPGLVDLHAHLRQPGDEEAETIESGSRAAALGGYTAVAAMPNTSPAIDSAGTVREVQELAQGALCQVEVTGAITRGRSGHELAPLAEMAGLGVRLFTDDGRGVADPALMRRALEYGAALGVRLAQHCEDEALSAHGCMHEGEWSSRLGLPGVPAEAEELMVARDLALARLTAPLGSKLHLQHLSTAGSVALVAAARRQGLDVTAEVTPHHLSLTDACLAGYDPVFKVNPPLRPESDVAALRRAVADGAIDAIATDHAPHQAHHKEKPVEDAPPGMLGLETALAVVVEHLDVDFARVVELMSSGPARILGIDHAHGGPVRADRPANLMVFDPTEEWLVDPARLASRSRNTPYRGRRLRGKVRHTVLAGEAVVVDGQACR